MYVCMYIYIYTHIHTYIYIHTYGHILRYEFSDAPHLHLSCVGRNRRAIVELAQPRVLPPAQICAHRPAGGRGGNGSAGVPLREYVRGAVGGKRLGACAV